MKRALMETSCLVALIVATHPARPRVLPWHQQVVRGEIQGVLAAHTLAETFSVLTRMPLIPRISPAIAWEAIKRNTARYRVMALTAREYSRVLGDLAARSIGGGPTYDALIAAVARKADVDLLLTLNPGHFQRVAPDLIGRIREP
jgi:predicted nucleic acid-binding protein